MKHLYKSLAAFQSEVPPIHKNTQGYGYSYAPLSEIFEVIKPLLKKHGMGFTQIITPEGLKTIIFHIESGEDLSSLVAIPANVNLKGMNEFQVLGSAITYIRRYSISAMLGLITDVDNDGNGYYDKEKVANTKKSKDSTEKPWLNEKTEQYWNAVIRMRIENQDIKEVRKTFGVSKKVANLIESDVALSTTEVSARMAAEKFKYDKSTGKVIKMPA